MAHWKDRGRHPAGGIAEILAYHETPSGGKIQKDPAFFKGNINKYRLGHGFNSYFMT